MAEKRRATKTERDQAPELAVCIPEFPGGSHPFSTGAIPEIYTPNGLRKVAANDSSRTDWFLKRLCTIWDITGDAVPFYFFDWQGGLRSLDAGCVGFLVNMSEPRLELNVDDEGYISSVKPTGKGIDLSRAMMVSLKQEMDVRGK